MQTNQKVQQESTMNFLKPIVRYVFQPVMNLKIKLFIAIFAAQVFIKVAMELLQQKRINKLSVMLVNIKEKPTT